MCLLEDKTFNCIQHRIKSSPMSVETIEINKIALKNMIIRDYGHLMP